MKFEIGDRVRCIDANFGDGNNIQTLKTGAEYIIQDINICRCGAVELNVGGVCGYSGAGWACRCGEIQLGGLTFFFSSRRFVKVQEKYKSVTIQVEKEEPILS